jgi:homoserine kinase
MSTSPVAVGTRALVVVPGTTANLGPGFDTLGMALGIYDELEVTATSSGVVVDVSGVGAGEVATDETNLVARSLLTTFEKVGITPPGLHLVAHNQIPHGRGLGSSGAAIVAGVMAAKGLLDGIHAFSDDDLLAIATDIEGHPDNIAPSLFGGLTIAWVQDGSPRSKKLHIHRGVSLLVAIPVDASMSTHLARSLQPETVPHQDAIFNLSRASLLIAALLDSPELLVEATEDRLHQAYRASAMPETSDLLGTLRGEGLAAVVSGAGPSILVLCSEPAERLRAADIISAHGKDQWEVRLLTVDERGATVETLPALAD